MFRLARYLLQPRCAIRGYSEFSLVLISAKMHQTDPLIGIEIQGVKPQARFKCANGLVFLAQRQQRLSPGIVVVSSGALLNRELLTISFFGVGLGECLCLFVAVQVLQDKALAAHRCAVGRSELESVIKGRQRFLVPPQINKDPPFAHPGFRGLRIKAHEFIIGKQGLMSTAQFSEHCASALMSSDTVRIPLEGLFIGRERFFVSPRLAQRGCFFEQLLNRHSFPVNRARLWNANRR